MLVAIVTTAIGYLAGVALLLALLVTLLVQDLLGSERVLDWAVKFVCRAVPVCFGWRIRVTGLHRIRRDRTYVFMANHVNIFDPLILYGYIPNFVRAVELEEHFSWPLWGAIIRRAGTIPISHRHISRAVESLNAAAAVVRRGASLLILPEGHRTRDGRLGPFMRGPFRVAMSVGADIVPLAMRGAYQRKNVHSLLVRPGRMELAFGAPLSAKAFVGRTDREVRDAVRASIETLLEQPAP